MKIIVQKVNYASVVVQDKIVGKIDEGLMLLVGFTHTDTEENIDKMIKKVINLRIFDDELGVMNKSLLDVKGSILSISQFTLYADAKKGNRPSYIMAAKGEVAKPLYELFNKKLSEYVKIESGIFGAEMKVLLENNGPTTIILEN